MKHIVLIVFCLLFPLWGFAAELPPGEISVSGQHELRLDPGYALIHTQIRQVQSQVAKSHGKMIQDLARLISALEALGIPEKDMMKSLIRQGPEYVWQKKKKKKIGYFSTCGLAVKVRDLTLLHRVYEELAHHDALEIKDTVYGRGDMEKQRRKALEKALDNARKKATTMARALDVTLGVPRQIRELGGGPRPEPMFRGQKASVASSPGGDFGAVRIRAGVSVVFSLVP